MVERISEHSFQDYFGRMGLTPEQIQGEVSALEPGAQFIVGHLGNIDAFGLTPEQLDSRIEELNLPVRSWHCFRNNGIETVRQLLGKTPDELLSLRHFGRTSYMDTVVILAEKGFFPKAQDSQGLA